MFSVCGLGAGGIEVDFVAPGTSSCVFVRSVCALAATGEIVLVFVPVGTSRPPVCVCMVAGDEYMVHDTVLILIGTKSEGTVCATTGA